MWAMAVGPVCLAIGLATGSDAYLRFGVALVWLTVLIPALAWLGGRYNAYRPGTRGLYVPAEWTFGDDGIRVSHPGRDAFAQWSEFCRWRSAAGALLLHTSRSNYIVIPWRDVADADRSRLEELLEDNIGRRKR
jgi:hypothetical protein